MRVGYWHQPALVCGAQQRDAAPPTRRCVLISRPGELGRNANRPAPRLVAARCRCMRRSCWGRLPPPRAAPGSSSGSSKPAGAAPAGLPGLLGRLPVKEDAGLEDSEPDSLPLYPPSALLAWEQAAACSRAAASSSACRSAAASCCRCSRCLHSSEAKCVQMPVIMQQRGNVPALHEPGPGPGHRREPDGDRLLCGAQPRQEEGGSQLAWRGRGGSSSNERSRPRLRVLSPAKPAHGDAGCRVAYAWAGSGGTAGISRVTVPTRHSAACAHAVASPPPPLCGSPDRFMRAANDFARSSAARNSASDSLQGTPYRAAQQRLRATLPAAKQGALRPRIV